MTTWSGRKLSWSTDARSLRERLGIGALVLAAVALAWLGSGLSAWRQLLLWALLVLALALLARRGWLKLFGPVFFFDLIRSARRQRSFFNRILYGGSLLVLVCWIYIMWLGQHNDAIIRADEMAMFAASFFYVFMIVQFVWGVMLTPAMVAGSIAEEKDRRTLEFILATDLRDREIVFGKLAARFANIVLLLLTGVPILSALQFLGGVDPGMMLAG